MKGVNFGAGHAGKPVCAGAVHYPFLKFKHLI
jgi:hypothetical protein